MNRATIALALSFALAACGDSTEEPDDSHSDVTPPPEPAPPPDPPAEAGAPNPYAFVFPSGEAWPEFSRTWSPMLRLQFCARQIDCESRPLSDLPLCPGLPLGWDCPNASTFKACLEAVRSAVCPANDVPEACRTCVH